MCVMKPIASAILFAVASLSIQASPILAQSSSPGAQLQTSNATALPEFVPSTGQTKYTLAVQENNSPSTAAREAAEALSAKFAGITTGSISKSDETMAEAAPATPVEHAAQPLLATASSAGGPADGRTSNRNCVKSIAGRVQSQEIGGRCGESKRIRSQNSADRGRKGNAFSLPGCYGCKPCRRWGEGWLPG